MDGEIDLFGHKVRPGFGKRGKPPHQPTEKDRNRVKMLLALEWELDRIADVLGISAPTFRKHYLSELKVRAIARDALEARKIEILWGLVEKGNVGAIKKFDELLRLIDADRHERRVAADKPEDNAPPRKLGKKGEDVRRALSAEAALAARHSGLLLN